ncbi:pyridoxal phosphate-dependent aminotransferase [Variovorax sp. J22G73]|uniref:pyridoxal phosphate-dependent aminotransferase n=1 Tax=unclassified Variovorax TaxID=663243 RepID=UPI002576AF4C|nr:MULTISPECIES: pyridoxal phosphate-dependent aminotransferase [unclassified Variovorax]MDM0004835.1 pyridoxal phosphate-dependent aminotransferase [Variovorax sp. J22R203]MDM0098251.1 pyridoxal phosphate-dependent aminotransferase [Variovorax sp. J22G73]
MLAQRLGGVKPSPSMAAKTRVDALRAAGRRIVDFTIGEPDFPTPRHIVEGGVAALLAGHTRYTASNGTPALRQAIADKLLRENALAYKPEHIAVGNGAKHIIYNAFAATLNEGDEVIVPAPYWVSYPDMVALHGGTPVVVPSSAAEGFKLTPAALEAAIGERTRWLVLNTPNNPTGAVYTRDELAALGAVLKRHPQVWLMTDEIYEHFVYGGATHVSPLNVVPELAERTLVINGVSKAYAMTGWRIGYGAGPAALIKAITLLLSQSTSCPGSMSQAAAAIALDGPQHAVTEAAALFETRRDRMVQMLQALPGFSCAPPDGAFYVFPSAAGLIGRRTPAGQLLASDVDVVLYLLEHAGVATIDGTSYGMPNHLRMSFATGIDVIEQGGQLLQAAVAELT